MAAKETRARYWESGARRSVRCNLCAHRCRIKPGRAGICQLRVNRDGELVTTAFGMLVSANADPIEKKPLSHYHPGTTSFSVASVGCNLRCRFCQNASISQWRRSHGAGQAGYPPGERTTPGEVVSIAERTGCRSISFTYTEPTISLEFAEETGSLARDRGMGSVFVTNGFMTPETVAVLAGFLDAANVDLKAMREATYRRTCRARLAPVLDTIAGLVDAGVWVEVTTLVVPGLNDSDGELAEIAQFLAGVADHIPWHISAFHPTYQMTDRPRTSVESLRRAHGIGKDAGLRHVYVGNAWGEQGESTFCPACGKLLIRRVGYTLLEVSLNEDCCPDCGTQLEGRGIAGARADAGGDGLAGLFRRGS